MPLGPGRTGIRNRRSNDIARYTESQVAAGRDRVVSAVRPDSGRGGEASTIGIREIAKRGHPRLDTDLR
jgi:hypothetical protein